MRSVVTFDLVCTLEELYNGATKKMRVKRAGREDAILEVKVQPGWQAGTKVTFKGEGDDGGNGVAQDICFVVKEAPHARFVRLGPNLVTKVAVDLADALCGDVALRVDMLDGSLLEFTVKDPVRPGQQIRVQGRGMPRAKAGFAPGDLVIECDIVWPEALSEQQKQKLREVLKQGLASSL